ncbi:DUF3298 domain-containing protein [Thalassobellus suaedae]|uniref:DUF4163 domain-containing protein n=1 Tax=Thalassobellus suaedae TaxID=3074124 RepID=A0ABY9XRG9_9FLAO|nr:DUF4163 domain-containing protein [Flavobacteriaceae bacterium HL-DH14]
MINKNFLFAFCCLLFLLNCKEAIKTTFSDVTISTKNNDIVAINIPQAYGNETIITNINSEINKAVATALHIGEPESIPSISTEESIISFNKEYQSFKTNFPESTQIWEAQIDGEILHQSPEIICIAITTYINTGGAHGNLNISFLNFNSETGHLIPNENLFKNMDTFKKTAKTYFNETIKDNDYLFDSESFELPQNIAYNEDGIVLLYNTYEIAPYASGIIEFTIPFENVSDILVFNGSY